MLVHEGSSIDVGIDIGKRRLAYSWPYWGLVDHIDLGKPGMRRDVELRQLKEWLASKMSVGVQLWIDQAYAGNGAISVAQDLSETISAVLTAMDWMHEPKIIHSGTWKAQIVGNHRAAKDDLRNWLIENHPALAAICRTEDEIDATIIALYGKRRSDGEILPPDVKRPKPKRRILKL